jgi:XTP/dITP diphosphohydrolase
LTGFTLVTGNRDKLAETARVLGFTPDACELDLPEIQSLDLLAVLGAKGGEAWRRLRRPVVVEETGLELAAFNGFPGPLVKWMLEAVGAAGIARAAHALGDPRATARCALLYRDGDTVLVAEGTTEGRLLAAPRGTGGFGWDPVFVPRERRRTYAELPPAVKDEIGHRGRAWRRLRQALEEAGVWQRNHGPSAA